mmetsp:Transcript_85583/g.148291  ORF Transcript_85583/g.148291 Transcript_85583/m.148291 type:complete len:169 (+) Transcript_85583:62-568(+)
MHMIALVLALLACVGHRCSVYAMNEQMPWHEKPESSQQALSMLLLASNPAAATEVTRNGMTILQQYRTKRYGRNTQVVFVLLPDGTTKTYRKVHKRNIVDRLAKKNKSTKLPWNVRYVWPEPAAALDKMEEEGYLDVQYKTVNGQHVKSLKIKPWYSRLASKIGKIEV